jgi:acyl carrier protein
MDISQRVIEIIADITGQDVSEESSLDEIAVDSADVILAVVELEEEYDISITDDEIMGFETVGDIVKSIRAYKGKGA